MSNYVEIPAGTTVWKKVNTGTYKKPCKCTPTCPGADEYIYAIAELVVTEPGFISKYESRFNKKGRVAAARVVEIRLLDTGEPVNVAYSNWDNNFKYTVGEEVRPDWFNDTKYVVCSAGIHCFLDRQDAVNY